jgi:hypothetical protein
MRYLKLFETFEKPKWQMNIDNGIYNYYFNIQDMWFHLTFKKVKTLDNVWERNYEEETRKTQDIFLGKNAAAIFPVIKDITEDFIKQEYPDMIVMEHLPMRNEEGEVLQVLNKRAKYNYVGLKTIIGYHLQYFNSYFKHYPGEKTYYGSPKTITIAFLIKNGTHKSPEDWINKPKIDTPFGEYVFYPVNP